MMENGKPRKRRQLSPEEKWEVFFEVCSQQLSQADAARKWGVDVSTVIRIRQLAKDAALAAFAASTTRSACTPRSATSPPTTSTTAAAPRSAAPASPGSSERTPSASTRIGGDRNDRDRDHPRQPPAPASAGRRLAARGGRPPARTSVELGTDDAPNHTHQHGPQTPSGLV